MTLTPPDRLSSAERAIWTETVEQVLAAGLIDRLDVNSLAAYVSAVATHQRATALLARTDILIERDGKPLPSPALAIQRDSARTIAEFARQFRLNSGSAPDPPARPGAAVEPVRQPDPMRGGRWCDDHHRYECSKGRKGGGICHGTPRAGADSCRMHSGKTKAVRAAERLDLIPTYGSPVKVTPERALMEELWRTAGHVKWLGDRVAELETAALTWGQDRAVTRYWGEFPGSEIIEKTGPHVLLDLYDRERRHLVHVAAEIIRAGLAARMVELAQEQGQAFGRCVDSILHDLELSEAQWKLVPVVVPRRFRELEAS